LTNSTDIRYGGDPGQNIDRKESGMRKLDYLAGALVLVGGLNWGLVAVAEFDLVAWVFGGMEFGETNAASRVVYGLVGLGALYGIGSLLGAGRRSTRPAAVGAH
jgi:uncharacterized protein